MAHSSSIVWSQLVKSIGPLYMIWHVGKHFIDSSGVDLAGECSSTVPPLQIELRATLASAGLMSYHSDLDGSCNYGNESFII